MDGNASTTFLLFWLKVNYRTVTFPVIGSKCITCITPQAFYIIMWRISAPLTFLHDSWCKINGVQNVKWIFDYYWVHEIYHLHVISLAVLKYSRKKSEEVQNRRCRTARQKRLREENQGYGQGRLSNSIFNCSSTRCVKVSQHNFPVINWNSLFLHKR